MYLWNDRESKVTYIRVLLIKQQARGIEQQGSVKSCSNLIRRMIKRAWLFSELKLNWQECQKGQLWWQNIIDEP